MAKRHPVLILLFLLFAITILTTDALAGGKGFYPNGQLQWETLFQNGEATETKWYDETGLLLSRKTYAEGKTRSTEGYRDDGSLEWQATHLDNNRQDVTRFDVVGQTTARYQLLDGLPDGEYTVFFADGHKKKTVTYRQGVLTGPARTYFNSGQVEHEFNYQDGKVDGPYRTYSMEGTLISEYLFTAGQLQ